MLAFLRQFGRGGTLSVLTLPCVTILITLMVATTWVGIAFSGICLLGAITYVIFNLDCVLVDSRMLKPLSRTWQLGFLTVGVGIGIAIRPFINILLVHWGAHIPVHQVFHEAFHDGTAYGRHYDESTRFRDELIMPFLQLVFLDWLMNRHKRHHWTMWGARHVESFAQQGTERIARRFQRLPGLMEDKIGPYIVLSIEGSLVWFFYGHIMSWLPVAAISVAIQLIFQLVAALTGGESSPGAIVPIVGVGASMVQTGKLEGTDFMLGVDGVSGVSAMTPIFAAAALSIILGGLFIRALTRLDVTHNISDKLVHLEHGTMWAVASLAFVFLWIELLWPNWLPGWVDGVTCIVILLGAGYTSWQHLKKCKKQPVLTTA